VGAGTKGAGNCPGDRRELGSWEWIRQLENFSNAPGSWVKELEIKKEGQHQLAFFNPTIRYCFI